MARKKKKAELDVASLMEQLTPAEARRFKSLVNSPSVSGGSDRLIGAMVLLSRHDHGLDRFLVSELARTGLARSDDDMTASQAWSLALRSNPRFRYETSKKRTGKEFVTRDEWNAAARSILSECGSSYELKDTMELAIRRGYSGLACVFADGCYVGPKLDARLARKRSKREEQVYHEIELAARGDGRPIVREVEYVPSSEERQETLQKKPRKSKEKETKVDKAPRVKKERAPRKAKKDVATVEMAPRRRGRPRREEKNVT